MKFKIILVSILSYFIFNSAYACKQTNLAQSKNSIDAILNDIMKNYGFVGGGGISEIKQLATNTYKVSLPQEEKIDLFTYELQIKSNCKAVILKKTESSEPQGPKNIK